jgi:hypothetical protein
MTRFEIYDTTGKLRIVTAPETAAEMRNLLGIFKTDCAKNQSAYEYNHFVNWAKKHHGVDIQFDGGAAERIDM